MYGGGEVASSVIIFKKTELKVGSGRHTEAATNGQDGPTIVFSNKIRRRL